MYATTPKCPRCQKSVYLAEQVVGPGRKFYHKPCLACKSCNRRLDSYNLLEHDEEPYCKACHVRNFGTRDLRQQNHPLAPRPRSASQGDTEVASPQQQAFSRATPLSVNTTGNSFLLRPTRALSPTSPTFARPLSRPGSSNGNGNGLGSKNNSNVIMEEPEADQESLGSAGQRFSDEQDVERPHTPPNASFPSHAGRPGTGNLPRTIPLSHDHAAHMAKHRSTKSVENTTANPSFPSSPSQYSPTSGRPTPTIQAINLLEREGINPLRQTPTGTRYGAALGGGGGLGVQLTGSPRKWGGTTPVCPKCSKSVYFAEQVKAVGKTYHKYCLRCTECGTGLDSTRLRDHDEQPFCVRCHNKLYGPQGSGYALLGKAGG
ncbi:hypothetical protein FA15DRAFT_759367 [Coprinopsis marcescibilis]|uniref:LIM zinc-binding domain-containing protein n=1 Tax=Coprinopsis marcescibilis TaxID=230819 RepID=A0A5C3KJR0_COPMA|nr:hypothetical protein FA15DRAFT_759367 [Coprinopsis marcescibilis]